MRTIKFRAWDKKRKVMQGDAEAVPDESYSAGIFGEAVCLNSVIELAIEQNQVLMQYTGLLDKHGKEIYEGDIVKYCQWIDCPNNPKREWETGNVFWDNNKARFTISNNEIWGMIYNTYQYEVIGNIYENKELLDVK